jgi:hypothetical protein
MAGGAIQYVLRIRDLASDALDDAAAAADELGVSLGGLGEAAAATSAALAGVAFGLNEIISASSKAILEIDLLSERTGVSRESIAGMQLALEGIGLEGEEVAGILEPLAERIADAAMGSEDAALGFERLGVSVLEADGSMRSVEAVLRDSIDALSQIENPGERAAAAMFSIQEAGAALTVALGGNSQALDKFVQQARQLGPDVSDPAIAAAKEIQTAYAQLGATLDRISQQITNTIGAAFGGDTATLIGSVRLSIEYTTAQISRAIEVFSGYFSLITRNFIDLAKVMAAIRAFEFAAAGDILIANEQHRERAVAAIGDQLSRDIGREIEVQERNLQSTLQQTILTAQQLEAGITIQPRATPTPIADLFAPPAEEADTATAQAIDDQTATYTSVLSELSGNLTGSLTDLSEALNTALVDQADFLNKGIRNSLIAQGIQVAADFGARLASEGPQAVAESMFETLDNLASFLQLLPEFLAELPGALTRAGSRLVAAIPQLFIGFAQQIPQFITEGILGSGDFLESLFQALVDLIIELPIAIARAILIDLPRAIGNAIRDLFSFGEGGGIGGFFESIGDRFRELGSDIRSFYGGSRQSGGFVDRTGMYLLHQGEYVTPGNNAAPRSAQEAIAGGPRVSVSVNAAVVDPDVERRLVERIRNSLSSYGRGYSLTPVI